MGGAVGETVGGAVGWGSFKMSSARGCENSSGKSLSRGVVQFAYGIKANVHIRETQRDMTTYMDEDPLPPIHAIVSPNMI